MINCSKCLTPNPDNANACLACGASLAKEKLQHAREHVATTPAPSEISQAPKAPSQQRDEAPSGAPAVEATPQASFSAPPAAAWPQAAAVNPVDAQREIDQYVALEKRRKQRKRIRNIVTACLVVGALGFYFYRDSRLKAVQAEVAQFLLDFRKVDDGPIAEFWRCTADVQKLDMRTAPDNLAVVATLKNAFARDPKKYPDHLRNDCVAMLGAAEKALGELHPPEGFVAPLATLKQVMSDLQTAIGTLAGYLDQRKEQTANEQLILDGNAAFHLVEGGDPIKAAGYYRVIKCAVPTFDKMVQTLKAGEPDTQPLVEFVYNTCKENPAFADTLRKECIGKFNEIDVPNEFKTVRAKMAGDDRDHAAIEDCFKRANKQQGTDEWDAVGKGWVNYTNGQRALYNMVAMYKPKE